MTTSCRVCVCVWPCSCCSEFHSQSLTCIFLSILGFLLCSEVSFCCFPANSSSLIGCYVSVEPSLPCHPGDGSSKLWVTSTICQFQISRVFWVVFFCLRGATFPDVHYFHFWRFWRVHTSACKRTCAKLGGCVLSPVGSFHSFMLSQAEVTFRTLGPWDRPAILTRLPPRRLLQQPGFWTSSPDPVLQFSPFLS